MNDLICPYCKVGQNADDDATDPSELHEQECSNCEKMFVFNVEYLPCYSEHKAPCLNGGEHEFKETHTSPEFMKKLECVHCEERKEFYTLEEFYRLRSEYFASLKNET